MWRNKLQFCICKDNTTVGGITLYMEVYHCSKGHSYSYGDNTAVGDIILCVEVYHYSRGNSSLCGGISYNSVCARIMLQYGYITLCVEV